MASSESAKLMKDCCSEGGGALSISLAASIIVGPGTALAFYCSLAGFYEEHFRSKTFFIPMLFSIYAPYPFMCALQAAIDSFVDSRIHPRNTYPIKFFGAQILIMGFFLAYMLARQRPMMVLEFGAMIGSMAAVTHATGHQLISAIKPQNLSFTEIGNQSTNVLPLIVFTAFGFRPTDGLYQFRHVILTVIIVMFIPFAFLCYVHFGTDHLRKGYERLGYDFHLESRPVEESELPDFKEVERQTTETKPLLPTPKDGSLPKWIWLWQVIKAIMTALMSCILSLSGYIGDASSTQFFVSIKLAADFLGRLAAAPIGHMEAFQRGPWHYVVCGSVALRAVLGTAILIHIGGKKVPTGLFTVLWCLFAATDRFMASLTDMTCGSYVEVKDRKFVSRLAFFFGFVGLLLGIVLSVFVAIPMLGLKMEWPGSDVEVGTARLYSSVQRHQWPIQSVAWGVRSR